VKIANDFHGRTQFPNCVGSVDGKQVRTEMPFRSGSLVYYNKHFSVDADYCLIAVAIVANGKSSESNDFKNSNTERRLELNQLGIPGRMQLPSDNNGKCMPFVMVGDEAFALSEHVCLL